MPHVQSIASGTTWSASAFIAWSREVRNKNHEANTDKDVEFRTCENLRKSRTKTHRQTAPVRWTQNQKGKVQPQRQGLRATPRVSSGGPTRSLPAVRAFVPQSRHFLKWPALRRHC